MNNKKVILVTIIIILLIIMVPLSYKIYKNHQNNLILVVEKEFLDKLTNPLNKKYYSEDSYVDIKTEEVKLI